MPVYFHSGRGGEGRHYDPDLHFREILQRSWERVPGDPLSFEGEVMEGFAIQLRRLRLSLPTRPFRRWQSPSQKEFAERFGLSVGAIRDAEQGRVAPSKAMRVLITAIELDPAFMEKAALLAKDRFQRGPTDIPS